MTEESSVEFCTKRAAMGMKVRQMIWTICTFWPPVDPGESRRQPVLMEIRLRDPSSPEAREWWEWELPTSSSSIPPFIVVFLILTIGCEACLSHDELIVLMPPDMGLEGTNEMKGPHLTMLLIGYCTIFYFKDPMKWEDPTQQCLQLVTVVFLFYLLLNALQKSPIFGKCYLNWQFLILSAYNSKCSAIKPLLDRIQNHKKCGLYKYTTKPVRSRFEWVNNTKKITWVQLSRY